LSSKVQEPSALFGQRGVHQLGDPIEIAADTWSEFQSPMTIRKVIAAL